MDDRIGIPVVVERMRYGIAHSTTLGDVCWCNGLIREQPKLLARFPGWASKALAALGAFSGAMHGDGSKTAEWLEVHPLDDTAFLKLSVSMESEELIWLITDLKRCGATCLAVENVREHLAMVLDVAPLGIWMQNGKGKLSFVNRAFCEAMGIAEADFLGVERYDMLLPQEFVPSCLASDAKALGSDSPTTTIQRLPMADGQIHDLEVYKAVHRNASGEPIALVGVAIEATAKLADRQVLLQKNDLAESVSRSKSEFISLMSHEFLTPLHGILGLAELLDYIEEAPEKREIVKDLVASAEMLSKIINAILAYTSLDLRSPEDCHVAFNIGESMEVLFDDIIGCGAQGGLSRKCEISPELNCWVSGDVAGLSRTLSVLLRNAIDFTQHGEIKFAARVAVLEQELIEVVCTISDTGIGIPDSFKPHLFTAFKQAEPPLTRSHNGIGLGLALSKRLVERMGGELTIKSSEGQGTIAQLKLRFDLVDPAANSATMASAA